MDNSKLQAAIEMYNAGSSSTAVAKFLDSNPVTTIKLLRENGVTIRSRGKPPIFRSAEDAKHIIDLRNQGLTHAEIGEKTGMNAKNLSRMLLRLGQRSTRKRPNKKQVRYTYSVDKVLARRIATLRDASFNYKVIAAMVGVSTSTVRRIASSN